MMKAALLWTINDFPALAMLSGWSTKGKLACPVCMGEVKAKQLKHGGKSTFYGIARYFLEADDPLRRSTSGFQKLVQQHYPLLNDAEKEQYQKENFKDWFERRVQDDEELKKKFLDLIRGPMFKVESYKVCKCSGYKFSCPNDKELTSTNSGVVVIGTSYNETYGNYYGRVEEILKLFYHNGHQVIVFKCHWFDHTTHVKVDRHRMTTMDVKSKLNVDDVFVLASQAHQVTWSSPNSKKGNGDKGKGNKRARTNEWDGEGQNSSAEESDGEGSYNLEEYIEKCSKQKIINERKRRSCSDGVYNTKPAPDAKPTLHLLNNGKGFMESKSKHLLSFIMKITFDYKTIDTKVAQREAFLDGCIEEFKEIDAEREARGEDPIAEEEFLGTVYNPSAPVMKNLQTRHPLITSVKVYSGKVARCNRGIRIT
ncbi:hypothetical protein AgCh_015615 [Apium graveolens]